MATPIAGRIQIIGSGAIGSLIAAGAQKNHIPYSLAARAANRLTQRLMNYSGQALWFSDMLSPAEQLSEQDLLVLPLKVFQLADAAREWRDKMHPQTPVLLLHNGMGGLESVREVLPKHPIYQATTSHAAMKTNPHEVKHAGFGRTVFGEAPDNPGSSARQLEYIFETLSRCLQPVTWHNNITEALWLKLAINAVINPLTTLHDIPNGELQSSRFTGHVRDICQEVALVMQAHRVNYSLATLQEQVQQVIKATAANFSSMHQDVKLKRRTEIDAINGFIVEAANKKGIDVPVNAFLYRKIKALESAYS